MPSTRLSKHHDRGAAEIEERFLFTSAEWLVGSVDLHDAANGHGADFSEC